MRCLIKISLLLLAPTACFAFGGKVTYPNGTPVAGAQVQLVVDDTSKPQRFLPPRLNMPPGAIGGILDDSQAVPKAKTITTVTSDSAGRFSFPDAPPTDAVIQIKAADRNDFAPVALPAKVFAAGEVAIVLQQK